RDTATPPAMCADLQRLLLADVLFESSRQEFEDWLRHNETGALMIRAGVPQTWSVGDKTGRCANGATNDIAILRPAGRAPILIAIYCIDSTAPADDRAAAIAEAACAVVEFLKWRHASGPPRRAGRSRYLRNSLPEFRRCANATVRLTVVHEKLGLSYHSSCDRNCRSSAE